MKKLLIIAFLFCLATFYCCNPATLDDDPVVVPKFAVAILESGKRWSPISLAINGKEEKLSPCQRLSVVRFEKGKDGVLRGMMNFPDSCGFSDNFLWSVTRSGEGISVVNSNFQVDCKVLSLTDSVLTFSIPITPQIAYEISFRSL